MQLKPHDTETVVDFDRLLRANVAQVFNERDPQKRLEALGRLWSSQPVLYEREAAISGADEISAHLSALQARLPADTVFTPVSDAVGHHGSAILKWQAGVPGHQAHTTGTDLAFVQDGRIHRFSLLCVSGYRAITMKLKVIHSCVAAIFVATGVGAAAPVKPGAAAPAAKFATADAALVHSLSGFKVGDGSNAYAWWFTFDFQAYGNLDMPVLALGGPASNG